MNYKERGSSALEIAIRDDNVELIELLVAKWAAGPRKDDEVREMEFDARLTRDPQVKTLLQNAIRKRRSSTAISPPVP